VTLQLTRDLPLLASSELSVMPVSAYIPHVIYSTAPYFTLISPPFHKKQAEMDRSIYRHKFSILESLAHNFDLDKDVSDEEVERLFRLAKTHEEPHAKSVIFYADEGKVRWKDVFWGKKVDGECRARREGFGRG